MPKITLRLNDASIEAAIKEVKAYENDLPKKAEKIRLEVADRLAKLCEVGFNGVAYDYVLSEGARVPDVRVEVKPKGDITLVIAHGKEAVFVEFGAGVYFNPDGAPHPGRGAPDIVAIGSYGYGRGKRQIWGYYEGGKTNNPDENRKRLRLTHGTPASKPMYYAAIEVAKMVPDIAREVFKGGGAT